MTSETERQNLPSKNEQAAEQLAPPKSALQLFTEAFNVGDDPPKESELVEKPQSDKARKAGPPKTLAALAETLGVDVSELYGIEVPRANNAKPFTLGQLKDMMADHESHEVKALKWEETRHKKEAELARAEQELEALYQLLPQDAIKPEKLAAVRQRREAQLTRERQRTLEAIPEWADDSTRDKEIAEMVEHMKDYGFSDSYLAHVSDHRTMRYIRENMLRDKRIKAWLDRVQESKPGTPPKSSAQQSQKRSAPTRGATREQRQVSNFMSTIQQAAGE